jgi:hypothetical protein
VPTAPLLDPQYPRLEQTRCVQANLIARFSTLCGRTAPASGRVGPEIAVAKRADRAIVRPLCPQEEGGNWPEMAIHRADDLAWFGPRWNAKTNAQGGGQHLLGARSARSGVLRGALAPQLPPPPTGRYPSDVSGAACLTGTAARRSCSACHGSFVRTCRSGCPAAPRPGGSSASTSVWRPVFDASAEEATSAGSTRSSDSTCPKPEWTARSTWRP